ncbi:SRPBCC family protein [Angustibacter sp. McL0619]|uniref:SRPBCC family protein n=1 Tax=Angustibacter sp. McL0619 TaxID=3415676 RepID=UPI003CF5D048
MTDTTLDGALRATPDGRAVRFEREYPTGLHDLWSALTEPARVARWLDRITGDLRVGGRVTVHFDDGPGELEVVACDSPRMLATRWLDASRDSLVTVRLTELAADRTLLVLDHTALTETSAAGYAAGWHWHLDALRAHLDGEQPPEWAETFEVLLAGYRQVTPAS